MFSPIVAISSCRRSLTVVCDPGKWAASRASIVPAPMSAILAASRTKAWNWSLRATKSVSEFTSRMAAGCPADSTAIRPSAATRPACLAALARPFLRSQSIAASMSPPLSLSALLQSIMPAPDFSRSSFTIAAVTFAMANPFDRDAGTRRSAPNGVHWRRVRGRSSSGRVDQAASLADPAVALDPAVQLQLAVDLLEVVRLHGRELPIMVDAGVVELLLELRPDPVELGQVVGRAARRGEQLEVLGLLIRGRARHLGQLLEDRRLRSPDVDAAAALTARDAVDRGTGHEVAVERDRAPGVVVRRHREIDAIGIAIGVDDRSDRDVQAPGLLDRQLLLIRVDHEEEVRGAAHVLDAAERLFELLLLAGEHQALLLGQARARAPERLVELAKTRDRAG